MLYLVIAALVLAIVFLSRWAYANRQEQRVWREKISRLSVADIDNSCTRTIAEEGDLFPPPGKEGLLFLDELFRKVNREKDFPLLTYAVRLGCYASVCLREWQHGEINVSSAETVTVWEQEGLTRKFDMFLFVYLKLKGVSHASFGRLADKIGKNRDLPL